MYVHVKNSSVALCKVMFSSMPVFRVSIMHTLIVANTQFQYELKWWVHDGPCDVTLWENR